MQLPTKTFRENGGAVQVRTRFMQQNYVMHKSYGYVFPWVSSVQQTPKRPAVDILAESHLSLARNLLLCISIEPAFRNASRSSEMLGRRGPSNICSKAPICLESSK
ncbi:hypothetical protein EJ03DRAFT_149521 [Teratosphaeria nubilosa]|uniref:Uncharacterized protein n=1 Tax=Teratosphaeria nubilosa TaxID=161662 RepID=A0A6G1LJ71_9PEZI|nr:hypothetical protein EJ03DRAFT_149521 [Teratosphaeria nubilosa]